jgi:hypothetical protein
MKLTCLEIVSFGRLLSPEVLGMALPSQVNALSLSHLPTIFKFFILSQSLAKLLSCSIAGVSLASTSQSGRITGMGHHYQLRVFYY